MNWTELRPLLRTKFGQDFTFYNDTYRSGTRRIKICTYNDPLPCDMLSYIKSVAPELDVKIYNEDNIYGGSRTRVTIHYR